MKKFILTLLVFGVFFFTFYLTAITIWGSFAPYEYKPNLKYELGSYGHMNTRISEAKKLNGVNILILGSSHAYRGFDTRIFEKNGFSAFNFGSSAQTPIQTKLLLKRYLKTIKPKLVLYEVFPGGFSSDGVESSLDIIANDKNDIYSLEMLLRINNLKSYNSFFYGSIRNLFKLDSGFEENIVHNNDTYVSGGFVERELKNFSPRIFRKKPIDTNVDQMEAFDEIIRLLKSYNIDYKLIFAPVTRSLYGSYTNLDEFNHLMKSKGDYYNFNELMELNDTLDFYDSHHLNQNGVIKFDAFLIDNYLK